MEALQGEYLDYALSLAFIGLSPVTFEYWIEFYWGSEDKK